MMVEAEGICLDYCRQKVTQDRVGDKGACPQLIHNQRISDLVQLPASYEPTRCMLSGLLALLELSTPHSHRVLSCRRSRLKHETTTLLQLNSGMCEVCGRGRTT